ncbi:predicted protein [Histoplasma capsulatum H143]|uniref:Uncharacterized protein n=1 Tax=Ajellomyces capsulatus (strain H143) TaxID=544712 RepID=C6HLK1_AJECH|nr:predicted protein [Histoplasma capsulatum H143]
MDRSIEVKPYLVSDNIPVDIFKVISGFTDNLLRGYSYEISRWQLTWYVRVLEDYDDSSALCQSCEDEGHDKRKDFFLNWLKDESILHRLTNLVKERMKNLNIE